MGSRSPMGRGNYEEEKWRLAVKYRDSAENPAKTA